MKILSMVATLILAAMIVWQPTATAQGATSQKVLAATSTLKEKFNELFAPAVKEEIVWAGEILSASSNVPRLLTAETAAEISAALTARLHELDASNELPFILKEAADFQHTGVMDEISGRTPIALIPMVIMADSIKTDYQLEDRTYHKSVVLSSLYLTLCRGGDDANSWTILGAIPINVYDIIGGNPTRPMLDEITTSREEIEYARITTKAIRNDLNFDSWRRILRNVDKKLLDDTYQVTEVAVTSRKLREVMGDELPKLQQLVGNLYSAKYEAKTKRVVYPPLTMSGETADRVHDSINVFEMKSPSGTSTSIRMPNADHQIKLYLSGVAAADLVGRKESDVVVNRGYKAWLNYSMAGSPDRELTRVAQEQYFKSGDIDAEESRRLRNIYTMMYIELTMDMAGRK